eukprot:12984281-Ditylum_brightwellii.AAC.1
MYSYLQKLCLFIYPDYFDCNNVVCVDEITVVNPKYVCREDIGAEITLRIAVRPAPDNAICGMWTTENNMEKGNGANVPNYKLVIGKRKYENGAGKVEATTFHVICKDKDCL